MKHQRLIEQFNLRSRLRFNVDEGQIWLDENRMLLLHARAIGALRRELIDTVGDHEARGMLVRMGFVAGMQDGPRPPFAVAGHWLYLGHKAVLHLIERPSPSGAPVVQSRESAARIDHLALRVDSAAQWEQLLLRLAERAIAFQVAPPNAGEERQLFVMPAPGVRVEFVIARQHLAGYG